MRIGIYGDSFAETYHQSKHIAWFNLLAKFIPNAKITSHGKGGSSVFFSYNKFLQTHIKYDFIIFLVTDPIRYTKPVNIDGDDIFPHSLREIEYLLRFQNISKSDKVLLENLKHYYTTIADEEYNVQMTELMLDQMEKIHPNIIFFPCFNNSLMKSRLSACGLTNNRNSMASIVEKQSKLLRINDIGLHTEKTNTISCHFSKEFNQGIASLFASKMLNGVWNWSAVNNAVPTEDKSYYYDEGR